MRGGKLIGRQQVAVISMPGDLFTVTYSGPAETFAAQLPAYNAVLRSVVVR